jgi:hypothetical protein
MRGGVTMEEIKGILELLKRFPEQIVVFQREDEDCIYHDGSTYCLSNSQGSDRIYDCWERLSEEKAEELLKTWLSEAPVLIYVNLLTPPYDKGIHWFT